MTQKTTPPKQIKKAMKKSTNEAYVVNPAILQHRNLSKILPKQISHTSYSTVFSSEQIRLVTDILKFIF